MRKKVLTIMSVMALCMLSAIGMIACENVSTPNTGINGTYYLYENGQLDKSQYIALAGGTWHDDDGVIGTYTLNGENIIFYSRIFGIDEEVYSGTLSSGKLSISALGSTVIYYKEGSEPTADNDPPIEEPPVEPDDCEYTVTFDLNYTGASRVSYPTENKLVTYIPTRIGYDFNGWYTDSELLTLFDISTEISEKGLVLYASWVEATTEVGQLSAPSVSVKDDIFMWNSIEGATKYQVVVTPSTSTVATIDEAVFGTSWVLPQTLDAGIYNVKIRAIGDGVSSVNSVYTTKKISLRVLDATSGIALDKATSVLSWREVKNAESYQVFINGSLAAELSDCALDISDYDAGQLTVKINAVKDNWLTSSASANISKMRLKVPEVTVSIDAQSGGHLLKWNTVRYADTYIIKYGSKEIQVNDTKYVIANNSSIWSNDNTATLIVDAFDSKADYLISYGAKPITINKAFAFSVNKNIDEAGSVSVNGKMWAPVTVSFDLNGASGSIAPQTVTTVSGLTYPSVPVRSGYIFTGWYTESTCKNLYDFTATVKESITLYAGWYSYSGNFIELNSGNKSVSSNTSYRYTYFRALSSSQIRIYYYQSSSTPTSYMMIYDATKDEVWSDEQSFKNTSSSMTSFYPTPGHVYYIRTHSTTSTTINLTLSTYPSDTFLPSDGGVAAADFAVGEYSGGNGNFAVYGESYTVKAAAANDTYVFLGWYDGEKELTKDLSYTFTPTKTVNITAKWLQCTVTANKNIAGAGTVTALNSTPKAPGSNVTVTAQTNLGYDFLGWYDGEKELTKDSSYSFVMPSAQITYTAKWKRKPEMSHYAFTSTETTATITGVNETVTELTIPNYVTSIGNLVFSVCRSLTSIEIPSSVTSIGREAFSGCSSLTIYCEVRSKPSGWDSSWNYSNCPVIWDCKNNDKDDYGYAYSVIGGVRYKLKDGTATIPVQPKNISGVIVIPSSITYNGNNYRVTSIQSSAFSECRSLRSIEIPSSVTSIGREAFSDCSSLTIYCEVTSKPSGWDSSWNYSNCPVIWDCKNNDKDNYGYTYSIIGGVRYKLKDGIATIVGQPINISGIIIPSVIIYNDFNYSVTSIGSYAFSECRSLRSIEIPSSVTSIGNGAFYGCSSLTGIEIPSGVTSIGISAFEGCSSLTSIEISSSVTSIGSSAFEGCSSLTSIEIPSGVTSIGSSAFEGCSSLTSIEIPSGVTSINIGAFSGCSSLTSIEIPSSVTSIRDLAFKGCSSLTIYCEVRSKPSGWDSSWNYSNCPVIWDCKNNDKDDYGYAYSVIGGVRYKLKDGTATIPVQPENISGVIVIPSSVTYNGNNYRVTSIQSSAFYGCSGLTSIEIPSRVTRIGGSAFAYCSNLTSIVIPNSVTSIQDYAFYNCSSLTIYCEAASQPSGWETKWNYSNCPVVWDYKNK